MFPIHGYVNPYCQTFPYHVEPNSYPRHYYYPGWEVMPQMKADPFKNQSVVVPSHSPSLSSENVCHPNSGCCHHSNSSGHYLRPQFSLVQPPPHVFHYGPFPPYPATYPAYFVPPPHYSVDEPRYDYDKAQNHCCGCPNHSCHQRDDSFRKIREQQDGDSSGLIRLPNYPPPLVWVPASSTKDREGDKAAQLQPGCQEDEGKKGQQDGDNRSQKWSPFPIIWVPGHDKPERPVKDLKEITPKYVEDWPSMFKIVPLKLLENENYGGMSKSVQEERESQVQPDATGEKEMKTKTIPVKQMKERSEEEASIPEKQEEMFKEKKATSFEKPKEESEVKASIPEKQEEMFKEKKATSFEKPKEESEVNMALEKKRSLPVRSSKLPPVCLRVDPLPRKKTNGASRSPSPPGHEDKRNHQHNEEQRPRRENREEISEKVIPVISVKDITLREPDKEQKCQESASVAFPEDLSEKSSVEEPSVQKTARHDNCLKAKEVTEGSKIASAKRMSAEVGTKQEIEVDKGHAESSESKEVKEKKGTKRNLSQTDAAIIIQSAYRGLEVRRWHPLEKLQKIAKVQEQAGNIRRQLESIEASSTGLDTKQRMVIGETIMSLLLELDTIQGLHPSVRESRKSVARELVCLQEKLDSLGSQTAEEHESLKVEAETGATDGEAVKVEAETGATDGEAVKVEADTGSDADKQQSSKWGSLEGKIDFMGNAAIKETEDLDVNHVDSPLNDEVVVVTSPSLSGEPDPKEFVQPAEGNGGEDEPSSENKTDRPDMGTAIVVSPSITTEPASDQGTNLILGTELLSGLVQPADENSASKNPSSEAKESDFKQEILEDMTREEAPTESDGSANAAFLVGNGPCEKEETQSSSVLVCTDEKGSKYSGEAAPGLDVKYLLEPLQEIEYQECEGAPVDHGPEDDAVVDLKLEQFPVQHVEENWNLGEVPLLTGEGEKLALDVGESVVHMAEDDYSEFEMRSCLELGCSQNAHEDLAILPPGDNRDHIDTSLRVEGDDRKDVSCPEHALEVDDNLKETMSDNLEVLATEAGSCTAGVAESNNENGLEVFGEEVGGQSGDVLHRADRDAIIEVGHTPVVRPEVHALALNEGPATSRGPPLGRSGKEAENPDQKANWLAHPHTTADMEKEEMKLLEENEKLREMLGKLLEAGKEQLGVISSLNGRVKDLERKLAQKKKRRVKVKPNKLVKIHSCEVSC